MNSIRLRYILGALAAGLLIWWGIASGLEAVHQHQGTQQTEVSHQQDQEAQSHAQAAQSIPDHSEALAQAQNDVDRARAEVARLKRILAAKPIVPLPATPNAGSSVPSVMDGDNRDQIIASQDVLIQAQDKQIATLKLALTDEQARSAQWQAAFEHEQKARMAQEVATKAWMSAVKESRWKGRLEGFAVGAAIGYVGGKL